MKTLLSILHEMEKNGSTVCARYTSDYRDHIRVEVDGTYYGIWSCEKNTWVD